MAKTTIKKSWKRDYGDGYETDDTVLWINGKPTENIVSPLSSECYFAYVEGIEVGMFSTRKEAKQYIENELSKGVE